MPNIFTGQEFAKNLSEGKLKEPLIKIGMAKKQDDSPDTILFAEGGLCDGWISIPVNVIEQVTFLQTVPCRDHRHPLVMIQFKEPEPGNKTASVFADLARRSLHATPMQASPGMPGRPPQTTAGLHTSPTQGSPGMPGTLPQTTVARQGDGGGFGGNGGLQCIVWHQVCGWTTLYISRLNLNIPFYWCWDVCDTWGLP